MSRRYDSRTTIFSPEGRLYQVEYAMEAISHAGTALGVLASDGVVLAAEKKMSSKLLEPAKSSEKMFTPKWMARRQALTIVVVWGGPARGWLLW